ncbi:CheR family methyltransferase [Lysinibacillus endophyticus]|uniref:CheR family methyltransferase n=1 Tax=Ureibacillus endophyticus TaxID=1978490 RepID=UPI00209E2CF0|nr:protein-glutamate O-methyltransferase CheR [Lysinibacillus endophyticus]MCP1144767.1 protein-glutamate O-methyltransferase CheR [Lysinibacillus endophyticus]
MQTIGFTEEEIDETEKLEIQLLLEAIYLKYGYDYRNYAYPSIRRRIKHRLFAEKLTTITSLLDKVFHDTACFQRLVGDFSINVTEMFRDPPFFKEFKEKVIPLLKTYPSIRIWHAGCSTGEEVYSMAILLQEEGLYDKSKIYATDINSDVLKTAKSGIFPLNAMKKYTNNYLQAGGEKSFSDYYKVTDVGVKFNSDLTRNVVFAQHNLVTDSSFNEFHVILCRNVLIYFNKELQNSVHELFYNSLGMFGVLCLGNKESITYTKLQDYYEAINHHQKIYRKIK